MQLCVQLFMKTRPSVLGIVNSGYGPCWVSQLQFVIVTSHRYCVAQREVLFLALHFIELGIH